MLRTAVTPEAWSIRSGRLLVAVLALVILSTPIASVAEEATPAYQESDFLTKSRQLIFDGARAGEGYFSPDGTKMVFQSEREPGNPFYQIYLMDMTTGDTRRVSPGGGKTTCAFIRPGSGDILFGSTHHDPRTAEYQQTELDFRASGKSRRYSWDYDPEMEVYVAKGDSGKLVNLTKVRGYDAEASYSPDGKWIVFSSMRNAYNRELSAEEEKLLEINPSYFGEIYHHAGRRLGAAPADRGAGLRRRALLLPRRLQDRLAAVRQRRPHRGCVDDESRRLGADPDHRLWLHELGSLLPPLGRVHSFCLQQARLCQLRESSWWMPPARRSRCR